MFDRKTYENCVRAVIGTDGVVRRAWQRLWQRLWPPPAEQLPADAYNLFEMNTRGGLVRLASRFCIEYQVAGSDRCLLVKSQPESRFTMTLVRSDSGAGKTTLLLRLHLRLLGRELEKSDSLLFDFTPDLTTSTRLSCGFVPQNPPIVKHWKATQILPSNSSFIDCFFDSGEASTIKQRRLGELSGGQCRRVYACSALERLLNHNDKHLCFLLLDETLDGIGASDFVKCINSLRSTWNRVASHPLHALVVTHLGLDELADALVGDDLLATLAIKESVEEGGQERLRVTLANQRVDR
jgi:ABC-type lipoprotein export system ATPase subunit